MSATEIAPVEATAEQGIDEELLHIVCCDDENIVLCGIDATDIPWMQPGEEPPCTHCERLYEAMEADGDCNRCPLDVIKALGGQS